MKKFKTFVDNILVYGLGSVIGRIIPFIMLPIITRMMPDSSYYGLNDLSVTLTSVGQAIAVFGMYDAMFRLFFDKDDIEYQKEICSTALSITLVTSVVVFSLIFIFDQEIANIVFKDSRYVYLVQLSAFSVLVGSTNNIVAAPTKIQNESKIYILVNTLSPVIAYAIAIPLLLKKYYSSALQLSNFLALIMIEIYFFYRNRKWFSFHDINWSYIKPLLKLGVPLMPSFLIYWIYNSADRLMVQYFLGTQSVGLYAIGSKMGQISNLICVAFTGGWLYFSYSTMKEEKQVENNSLIFEYMGLISFAASIVMCTLSYLIYKIFFTEEYFLGYKVAPYLFLAPLLQVLFQIAGNQFIIMKKSFPSVLILLSGAIANICFNCFLIPQLGIEGAAIGTLVGYVFADVICLIVLVKIKKFIISRRFLIVSVITFLYFIVWAKFLHCRVVWGIIISILVLIYFMYLFRQDIKYCVLMFNSRFMKK